MIITARDGDRVEQRSVEVHGRRSTSALRKGAGERHAADQRATATTCRGHRAGEPEGRELGEPDAIEIAGVGRRPRRRLRPPPPSAARAAGCRRRRCRRPMVPRRSRPSAKGGAAGRRARAARFISRRSGTVRPDTADHDQRAFAAELSSPRRRARRSALGDERHRAPARIARRGTLPSGSSWEQRRQREIAPRAPADDRHPHHARARRCRSRDPADQRCDERPCRR